MTLTVTFTVIGRAQFIWTSGPVPQTSYSAGQTLTISGTGDHDFNAQTITNNGAVNWTGGNLRSGNAGGIVNNASFNDSASAVFNNAFGGAMSSFLNAAGATYNKSAAGTTTFEVPFNNQSTVAVGAGTLALNLGGSTSAVGSFSVASGAGLTFSGGTYTLAGGASLNGLGAINLTGGLLSIPAGAVTFSNLSVGGGTLDGAGTAVLGALNSASGALSLSTLTLAGPAAWSGGSWNSATGTTATVNAASTLTISSLIDHDFSGRILTNNGTINWTGGNLRSGYAGGIVNNASFNDSASAVFNNAYGGAMSSFLNATGATYTKSAGATTFDVPFNNNGAINLTAGTLDFAGTGSSSGTLTVNTAGTVRFLSNFTIADGSSLLGAGAYLVTGGTFTVNGSVTLGGLQIVGGTLAGTHAIAGTLTWSGGSFNSTGTTTINAGGTLAVSSGADHDFNSRILTNNGTVNWTAGRLRSGNGGAFINNGLVVDAAASSINNDYGGATATFTNAAGATYRKTTAGTTTFQLPFINSGQLDLQAGTLALTANATFNDGTSSTGAGLLQQAAGLLTINGTSTFADFQLAGGTITGVHTLAGNVRWTGGSFNSVSTTTLAGTTTIDGVGDHDFSSHTFVNSGTINWLAGAGRLRSGNGGIFTNSGTFNDAASTAWNNDYGGALAQFTNTGTGIYNKTAAGTTTVGLAFVNQGRINALAGSLDLAAGGSAAIGARFDVATGASLRFTGGTFSLPDSTGFSGTGTVQIAGAWVTLAGNVSAPVFSLAGGTLAGSQTFLGNVTWSGGDMNAAGTTTIGTGASLTINSAADHDFTTHALVNNGLVSWTGGRLRSGGGGTFTNQAVFNDTSGSSFNSDYGGAAVAFTNTAAGTYNKSGANTTTFLVPFNNSGTVTVAADSVLNLNTGGTIGPGASYGGSGTVLLSGGVFAASGTLTSTNLVLGGATIDGTHTVAGTLAWNYGNFNATGTTTLAGGSVLNIASVNDHDFSTHSFVNNGTVNWTGGRLRSGQGGTFTNHGTFVDTASSSVNSDYGGTSLIFSNAAGATYAKSGPGTTTFLVPFVNSGTLLVQAGTLSFASTFSNPGGSLVTNGTSVTFANPLDLGTGTLAGSGTITAPAVIAGGLVSPGNSPGQLTISGDLSLLATSTTLFELGGTTQGVTYDFLSVGGNAALNGTLQLSFVNSFQSAVLPGNTFTLLSAPTVSGAFTNVPTSGLRLFTTDGAGSFQVNYSGTALTLTNFVPVPEPSTWTLLALGVAALALRSRRQR